MQLSAANLLVAAQQIARQVQQPSAKAFSAALASETDDLFAPLDFKQTAGGSAPRPASTQSAPARMGTQLDIRI